MTAPASLRTLLAQVGTFGAVGIANTLLDIAIFWALTHMLAVPPVAANVVSFSTGALCSFTLNQRVTFRATRDGAPQRARIVRFLVTTAITLSASTASLAALLLVAPPMVAKLLSVGVTFAVGFLLQRNWVFAARPPAPRR